MHTGTLKKMALALTFWLALHMSSLKAQIIGPDTHTNTAGTITFEIDNNGVLWDSGLGNATLSLSGAGTRMFWYPGKAAFRAGSVNGTQWDNTNIGQGSVAFGLDTTASGSASTASGFYSSATGTNAVAMGAVNQATGDYSTAMGVDTQAIGQGSTAMGSETQAIGGFSNAMGWSCSAYGWGSVAMGIFSSAIGNGSLATGRSTSASGFYSTAMGFSSTASGYYSTSSGYNTQANAYASFVIGAFNVGLSENNAMPSLSSWNNTPNQADPLFEVGNGTSSDNPSDAFVVYKDGNAAFQGQVTVPQSGDIPMYGE